MAAVLIDNARIVEILRSNGHVEAVRNATHLLLFSEITKRVSVVLFDHQTHSIKTCRLMSLEELKQLILSDYNSRGRKARFIKFQISGACLDGCYIDNPRLMSIPTM